MKQVHGRLDQYAR